MIDFHVHSRYSGDSQASMRDMCVAAVDAGLSAVVFTEHIDFAPSPWSNLSFDYDRWMRDITALREEFAGRLSIIAGAEVEFQREYRCEIEDFLSSYSLDYVLGAVHYGNGMILEDHKAYFPGKTAYQAYAPYFENVLAAIESGFFDTIAHLDLCKRYGVNYYGAFRLDDYRDLLEPALVSMIERGVTLEVNTSGLRQPPGETYPAFDTIALYMQLGGRKLVLGSDAHRPHQVAYAFDKILTEIKRLGYDSEDFNEGKTKPRV